MNAANLALGLFVVWQLVFLLAANLAGVFQGLPPEMVRYEFADGAWRDSLDRTAALPNGTSAAVDSSSGLRWLTDRWGEGTGQWQGWAMFAPEVPTSSYFLTTTLRWNDDASTSTPREIVLRSPCEPDDPKRYWIPALTTARRYNFEWRLALAIEIYQARQRADHSGGDTAKSDAQLREWIARQAEPLRAYARVRLTEWLAEHAEAQPPDEVVLSVGEFRRVDDGPAWQALPRQPIVRWRPTQAIGDDPAPAQRELEYFAAERGSFAPLVDDPSPPTARRGT
ncbi:MAG: hypothetical protein AB7U73_06675 [Pirellulales bacterium]